MIAYICLIVQGIAIILLSYVINRHTKQIDCLLDKIEDMDNHLLVARFNLYHHIEDGHM